MSNRRRRKPFISKGRISVVVVMLVISLLSYTIAMSGYQAPQVTIEYWVSQEQDSVFTITELVTRPHGENKVKTEILLLNTDVDPHQVNVTILLLNSTGDIIILGGVPQVYWEETAVIAGGDDTNIKYKFEADALLSAYDSSLVILEDTA